MGLEEFKRIVIRSAVMGIKVTINEEVITRAARCSNTGKFHKGVKKNNSWVEKINDTLHKGRPTNKTCDMLNEHRVLQNLIFDCFMPRDGGSDYKSLDHNLFLYFFIQHQKVNLPEYMFHYMSWALKESIDNK